MNCIYCNREINNKGSLKAHQNTCKNNPQRIKYVRSPLAGAKKGSIPWNFGKQTGIREGVKVNGYGERRKDEEVFVENSTYDRKGIKKRILDQNLIQYKCDCCGIGPEWNGKPMPLILDHVNGISNDHRLSNLRFVCSNCDSQLDTYKSRNKGRSIRLATEPHLKCVER